MNNKNHIEISFIGYRSRSRQVALIFVFQTDGSHTHYEQSHIHSSVHRSASSCES